MPRILRLALLLHLTAALLAAAPLGAEEPVFTVSEHAGRLAITCAGSPVAEYVFQDERILRPYFANVRSPGGQRVTRSHPPVPGVDATDHDTMHPGLWLGFGDLGGSDFWRNQGRIEHVRFVEPPEARGRQLAFTTESRLLSPENRVLSLLTSRFLLAARPFGWLLIWDATFRSDTQPLTFGDQEEMGFGARVATPLTEKQGGRLVNSLGQSTAAATWGQPANWCDYAGRMEGRRVGITLMAAPLNFRPSWWHNRDYGVFVANPFGRAAMRQGEKSRVVVPPGEPFRIVFGACLHDAEPYDPEAAYAEFTGLVPMPLSGSRQNRCGSTEPR